MKLGAHWLNGQRDETRTRTSQNLDGLRLPIFEPVESLGEHLKLPAFLEPHRKDIEGVLPSLERAA